ncbi:hypothetical protein HPB48_000950 [Haemaphysalis longicornis]|uniref:Uncharacterized protein n=1 Tax=Haemaphysalis longicornis TaxID=44386 RepID=A0A9J6G8R5_HAELO|nr:hypothetical protein HPB48_000950 [Haemaphysalis longicornis]
MGKLEAGQGAILTELKGLKERQDATDRKLKLLTERLGTLETKVASKCTTTSARPSDTLINLNERLTTITARCYDAENSARRCNVLFYGIQDDPKEDWPGSEQKIVNFCSDKLKVTADTLKFDRVHRLGGFAPDKCRPIFAKFCFFKDKQTLLVPDIEHRWQSLRQELLRLRKAYVKSGSGPDAVKKKWALFDNLLNDKFLNDAIQSRRLKNGRYRLANLRKKLRNGRFADAEASGREPKKEREGMYEVGKNSQPHYE